MTHRSDLLKGTWVSEHSKKCNHLLKQVYMLLKGTEKTNFVLLHCSVAFFPLHIGDHVIIEEDCVINAAQVGSYVHIGKNCVIVSKKEKRTSQYEGHGGVK